MPAAAITAAKLSAEGPLVSAQPILRLSNPSRSLGRRYRHWSPSQASGRDFSSAQEWLCRFGQGQEQNVRFS